MQGRETETSSLLLPKLEIQLKYFHETLANFSAPGFLAMFWSAAPTAQQLLAQELSLNLNLNNMMSRDDLAKALLLMESISVAGEKNLSNAIEKKGLQVLSDLPGFNSHDFTELKKSLGAKYPLKNILQDVEMENVLIALHQTLYEWYKTTLKKANDRTGKAASSVIDYTPEMLKENQTNQELIAYTKKATAMDASRITLDVIRKGVTFNGVFIKSDAEKKIESDATSLTDMEEQLKLLKRQEEAKEAEINESIIEIQTNFEDEQRSHLTPEETLAQVIKIRDIRLENDRKFFPHIIKVIEDLGGAIDEGSYSSQAGKIYSFGGQQLEAQLIIDFQNTTVNPALEGVQYTPAKVSGHINWFKDDKGEIKAEIKTQIYTCQMGGGDYGIYAMGSDGATLVKLDMDNRDDEFMARLNQQKILNPYSSMLPICEITAEISLSKNKEGYYLEITRLHKKFNTPDLVDSNPLQMKLTNEGPNRPKLG